MIALPEHLHPMVVHFPVALFITALGFEVAAIVFKNENLHKAALRLYVAAAFITPFVVWTGEREAARLNMHHPLLEAHEECAEALMWTVLGSLPVLWVVHKHFGKYFRWLFLIALIAAAVLVTLTGDKGGHMVFEYGAGVES